MRVAEGLFYATNNSRKALLRQLPYSSRHLYRLGAMAKFPRRTRTGPGRTGYREAQIEE